MKIRNTFVIFLVSGFWHGANWTFIIWGALNAIYFLPLLLTNNNRKNLGVVAEGKLLPSFRELFAMLTTFMLTVFAWIFFRADNINHAFNYISEIFSESLFLLPLFIKRFLAIQTLILAVIFFGIEWYRREDQHALASLGFSWKPVYRYLMYYSIIFAIYWFYGEEQQFIYFQF